jgi:hypothetical protein
MCGTNIEEMDLKSNSLPPDWKYGVRVGEVAEAPLPRSSTPLHWYAGDTRIAKSSRVIAASPSAQRISTH